MEIEVKPLRGYDPVTKKERDAGVYQIRVDGKQVGFIGHQDGACPMLYDKRSPLEAREIEKAVAEQLAPQRVGPTRQATEPPPEKPPKDIGKAFE